jgi:hypothetical protein
MYSYGWKVNHEYYILPMQNSINHDPTCEHEDSRIPIF